MPRPGAAYQFDLSGGAVCLDFANTLGDRPRAAEEHLHGWSDLVRWAGQAGLLSKREASARASRSPRPSEEREFAAALALRERLYRIFSAVAAGRAPDRSDLAALNTTLGEVMSHARLVARDEGFAWSWDEDGSLVARALRPVIRSAADLLVSAERADVRECASGTCSWLFVDRSRTHRRRWCSMKTCGNRDKARRFYQRQQTQS